MSDTVKVLTRARELVARGWTQEAYAKNDEGNRISLHSDGAVCWCSMGAISAASFTLEKRAAGILAKRALCASIPCSCIPEWNDDPARNQAEVVAAFDRAIQYATDNHL